MPIFKTTSSFQKSLLNLLKVKRNVYASVVEDINTEFAGKNIIEIIQFRIAIQSFQDSKIIKLRCKDSHNNLSKKDGYRLIYFVSQSLDLVVFLQIYPKRGPLQKIDLEPNELKDLILELREEMDSKSLKNFP